MAGKLRTFQDDAQPRLQGAEFRGERLEMLSGEGASSSARGRRAPGISEFELNFTERGSVFTATAGLELATVRWCGVKLAERGGGLPSRG
jgi:hypothetical protein